VTTVLSCKRKFALCNIDETKNVFTHVRLETCRAIPGRFASEPQQSWNSQICIFNYCYSRIYM